jgi:hypothetical protein
VCMCVCVCVCVCVCTHLGFSSRTRYAHIFQGKHIVFLIRCSIERKKSFQRFLERRKVLFKVMHTRGFLRSDLLIGKGEVVLSELLTRCEVTHAIPVCW